MGLRHDGILRLGYVRVALRNPGPALDFYREHLGLLATEQTPDRTTLRCWHEPQRFTYVVERSDTDRLVEIGFEVRDRQDLENLALAVSSAGRDVQWVDAGAELPGLGTSVAFTVPGGHRIRLVERIEHLGYPTGHKSPDWNPPREVRATVAPLFLLHAGITVPDPGGTVAFFTDVLGFRIAEVVRPDDDPSQVLSALLFRTTNGQDLAVFPGREGGLHHLGFSVEDESDVMRTATYLVEQRVHMDLYGTTVQPYGNTFSLHFMDPAGLRIELFSGGRYTELHPEFQPVEWTESAFPAALAFLDTSGNKEFLEACL
jgi:catechol 2,3-dioxygenase